MAQLLEPLPDPTHRSRLAKVQLRSQPDLPDHVLGQIQWLSFSEYPGYHLWNETTNTNYPVEFIENYWYYIYRYDGNSYMLRAKDPKVRRAQVCEMVAGLVLQETQVTNAAPWLR